MMSNIDETCRVIRLQNEVAIIYFNFKVLLSLGKWNISYKNNYRNGLDCDTNVNPVFQL